MATMIKRVYLNTNIYNEVQSVNIYGGRVVKAMNATDHPTPGIELLCEMDINTSLDAITEPTNFIVLTTGSGTPKGLWHYIDSVLTPRGMLLHIFQELKGIASQLQFENLQALKDEVNKSIMDPIEVAKTLGLPVPEELLDPGTLPDTYVRTSNYSDVPISGISPSTGYPLSLAYNVTVYFGARSEILFQGKASRQGVLVFIKRFTERGSDPTACAQMMGTLKEHGYLETANHILDGMKYSMVIDKGSED